MTIKKTWVGPSYIVTTCGVLHEPTESDPLDTNIKTLYKYKLKIYWLFLTYFDVVFAGNQNQIEDSFYNNYFLKAK